MRSAAEGLDGTPTVSVVVPVFNRAKTIEASLDSVRKQTYPRIELIVVDDGSTDDSVTTVEGFAARWPDFPLRLVTLPENRGVAAARNAGLARASGQYISFLDSDDLWQPRFLSELVGQLERASSDYGCAVASLEVRYPDGSSTIARQSVHGDIYDEIHRRNAIGPVGCAVFQLRVLQCVGGFDTRYPTAEDLELFIRLSQHTRFLSSDQPLYIYHQNEEEGRLTRNYWKVLKGYRLLRRDHLRPWHRSDRVAYAKHCKRVGDALLRLGRARRARRVYWIYRAAFPRNAKIYGRLALTYLPDPATLSRVLLRMRRRVYAKPRRGNQGAVPADRR